MTITDGLQREFEREARRRSREITLARRAAEYPIRQRSLEHRHGTREFEET